MLKFTVNFQSQTNIVSFKCLSSSLSAARHRFVTYFAMAFDTLNRKYKMAFLSDKVVTEYVELEFGVLAQCSFFINVMPHFVQKAAPTHLEIDEQRAIAIYSTVNM